MCKYDAAGTQKKKYILEEEWRERERERELLMKNLIDDRRISNLTNTLPTRAESRPSS
jgi:hypothetical protein